MMNMKVNKSKLFKVAYAILHKSQATTFSEALTVAWKAMKIYTSMLTGQIEFKFRKVNGEIRKATGTLQNLNYVTKASGIQIDKNADIICFWDCEKNAFRSFRAYALI